MSSYPPQQPSDQQPPYTPPPSYGQQPQPPYGQQPAYNPYGGTGYTQPKTNGLAIAGFILSFFISLVGLILSIVALNQINKSNGMQKGKGLAIAGIIIGAVSMVAGVLLTVGRT